MAINKRITELNPLGAAAANDVFAIVDNGAVETKKISASNFMAYPLPIGSSTPNTGDFSSLSLPGTISPVNEFSTDITLSGDSDTAVPTEKAVKTYVDAAVANAVQINILNISNDSTAGIGDVLIVDSGSGDVNVELISTGQIGKIIVYKNSSDGNDIIITTSSGTIDGQPSDTFSFPNSSKEYVTDGSDFYTI